MMTERQVGDTVVLDYDRRYVDEPAVIEVEVIAIGPDFFNVTDGTNTWSVLHYEIDKGLVRVRQP